MKPKTVRRAQDQTSAHSRTSNAGMPSGSVILTLEGELPVEHVLPGDRIITRDTGMAVVKSVLRRKLCCRGIRIMAGSLGDTRPDRDVLLPEDQPILVRDWRAEAMFGKSQATVRAVALVDGQFIIDEGVTEFDVIDLCFDKAHTLYVDGLEVSGQVHGEVRSAAA